LSAAADKRLDTTLSALADPTRRRVVDLLRVRPRRAGELVAAFDVSAPAISRHLRLLRSGGLIEELRDPADGRGRVYQLRPDRFEELAGWLREIEEFWTDQLDSFRDHVENHATKRPGTRVRTNRRHRE
jgi:DNA-binding transcriptional ArsR family regulator